MANISIRRFLKPAGDPSDVDGLFRWMRRYLDHIEAGGYTLQTLWSQERYLRDLIHWCDGQHLSNLDQIDEDVLQHYLRDLHVGTRHRMTIRMSFRSRSDEQRSLEEVTEPMRPLNETDGYSLDEHIDQFGVSSNTHERWRTNARPGGADISRSSDRLFVEQGDFGTDRFNADGAFS